MNRGSEGYVALVLTTYRFLISWHTENSDTHASWLEPRSLPGTPLFKKVMEGVNLFGPRFQPIAIVHNFLIIGNTLLVVGGSMVAGGHNNVDQLNANLAFEKPLRVSGQALFLIVLIFLLYCICISRQECRRKCHNTHPTLSILLVVWPLLFVRGIYGLLAAIVPIFNYFNFNNYTTHGLKDSFVISEYILGTSMEWMSCVLLMLTWFTSYRFELDDSRIKEWKEGELVVED